MVHKALNTILVQEGQIKWSYLPILAYIFFIFFTRMANNSYIKVVSWNINGCGNLMKQAKGLLYLKHKQADLACIQTHLKDDEAKKFKRDGVGQVYYSSFSSKKNGVLILVHKRLTLSMVKEFKDANGRIICLETVINGTQLTLQYLCPQYRKPIFFP